MRKCTLFLSAFLMAGALTACKPKLDTSSKAAFVSSYTRMRVSLDASQRDALDAALLKVASKDVREEGSIDVVKHMDDIIPRAQKRLDGKTAEQIIAAGK